MWVIPRKRTLGRKAGWFQAPTPVWAPAEAQSEPLPLLSSLKERLQGSSLLLLSGEEAEVGTMGAGGPSIFDSEPRP